MAQWRRTFFDSPKLASAAVALAAVDVAGLYLLVNSNASEAHEVASPQSPAATPAPPAPAEPPPPAMIHPPPIATVLRSGTLIVISKKSQNMFVFSDGQPWASTPISTGKRRHETPSGVFPILQKRKMHRSNIYSGAPMPYMQRLTWDGIALHAGWVPGYPASHGCVRVPRAFAQSLFKLTDASATTVVIGDDALETDAHAQEFALTAQLPIRSALAPPAPPRPAGESLYELARSTAARLPRAALVAVAPPSIAPIPPAAVTSGQTIQLAAAASQAEAEAHWARLVATRPDLGRYQKTVEIASVNFRPVYRLRMSGADANSVCAKLKSEGISCFAVS
jgi:lipoprotein-anchoring transpeptidase ErfK/SrfK